MIVQRQDIIFGAKMVNAQWHNMVEKVIIFEEGGWSFGQPKNDISKWTFAGFTRDTAMDQQAYAESELIAMFSDSTRAEESKQFIYAMYYYKFIIPLELERMPERIRAVLYSWGVNRGVMGGPITGLRDILRAPNVVLVNLLPMINKLVPDDSAAKEFNNKLVDTWIRQYIRIAQGDARSPHPVGHINNLMGWYNRASSYLL